MLINTHTHTHIAHVPYPNRVWISWLDWISFSNVYGFFLNGEATRARIDLRTGAVDFIQFKLMEFFFFFNFTASIVAMTLRGASLIRRDYYILNERAENKIVHKTISHRFINKIQIQTK